MLGLCRHCRGSCSGYWAHVGSMLVLCCAILGPCWAHVGPMLGPCWAILGLCCTHVGPMLSHVGPMLSPNLAT